MCYSQLHPPTYHPHLFTYAPALPPSYLSILKTSPAGLHYLDGCQFNGPPNGWQWLGKNKMKVLHWAWSFSLKQINMGTIKLFDTLYKGITSFV
jgi:hypothetical protein